MKIKKLVLENITCFEKAELVFNRLTIISGRNSSGKSTIVESLKKLLTGVSNRNLLRDGTKTGNITAEIDNYTLTRGLAGYGQSLEITGLSGPMTHVQGQFLRRYNLDADKVSAILDPESFLEMNAAKKQSILASLLNLNFRIDELVGIVQDKNVSSWLSMQKDSWENLRGIELLDTIYKFAYQARRDANRDVKTLSGVVPEINFPESLEELAQRRSKLLEEQKSYFTSLTDRERRKKAVESIEKEKEALAKLELTIPKVRGDIDLIKYDLKLVNGEIDKLLNQRNTLSGSKTEPVEVCPVFSVSCPLSPDVIKEQSDQREKLIENIDKELAQKEKEAEKLQRKLEKLEKKAAIQETIAKHKENIDQFERIIEETKDIHEARPIGVIQKELEEVNRKIAELQAAEKYKKNLEALKKAHQEAEFYDQVVKVFDPKTGLKAKLLQQKIEKLTSIVNQALQVMSEGYSVNIDFEPQTQIKIISFGRTIPESSLSESERMRLGVAFQYAFSLLSGAKILVIDRGDMLDRVNRDKLSRFITSVIKDFDTVILLHTHNTASPVESPTVPWITTYYLENGQCREVIPEKKTA